MTTYDPGAIRAQIKSLLNQLTTTTVSYVYDFNNPNIDGYPAVIFDITDESNNMLDDSNNMRVITFTMYVITEIKVAGLDPATTILDNAVKSIINLVEKKSNDTLSDTVDWVTPVLGKRAQTNSPEGNFIYQELQLKCNIASTIL